jgi:hypothetical protein
MKKLIIILFCLAFTTGFTQSIIIPGHQLSRNTPFGKVVSTKITNTDTTPATFIFSLPAKFAGHHFETYNGHTEWLLSHIKPGMDTIQAQLALMKAEISFIKSPYFVNAMTPMDPFYSDVPDSLYARMFARGASTGWFVSQCGQFWRMFYTDLIGTGYFKVSQFKDANLRQHVTGEVMVGGSGIWVDTDPSMPTIALVPDEHSSNHYASAATVKNNLSILKPYWWISQQGDSIKLTDARVEDYWAHFDSLNYSPVHFTPVNAENSLVILPPGASLFWTDTIGHIIDMADKGSMDTVKKITSLLASPNLGQLQLDSADRLVYGLIGIPLEELARFHDDPNVSVFFINAKLYESKRALAPVIRLNSGPGEHVIGRDIKYPGFITNVDGFIQFNDTTITGGVTLWNASDKPSPFVPYKLLHFLSGQGTVSGGAEITLSFNPMLGMNFYHDVIINQLDKPDKLLIEKWDGTSLVYTKQWNASSSK